MKNKNIFITLIVLILFLCLMIFVSYSLGVEKRTDSSKTKVLVTIFPLYDIVNQIGGDAIDVVLLLPVGASPHTFEATPELVKTIYGSELLFKIGAGLDDWSEGLVDGASSGPIQRISMAEYIQVVEFSEDQDYDAHLETEENHQHEGPDPHFWLDPDNGLLIAETVKDILVVKDPENTEIYEENYKNFAKLVRLKDEEWKIKLDELSSREIAVFHDAWNYFSNHFNLEVSATFEPFPGKAPSPKYLVQMSETIREKNIKAIFIEPQLSDEAARVLANDLGIEVGVLDPLGGFPGRETYMDMLEYNVNQVYLNLIE